MDMRMRLSVLALVAGTLAWSACCAADIDPVSGIDLLTIGAPGNAPYTGPDPFFTSFGRGQVNYEYRVGKTEVTTAQWIEFFNAAFDRPTSEWNEFIDAPTMWGASAIAPTTPGGLRWGVFNETNAMRAVGGITWRTAAIYCNWLHNGKSLDTSAFMNGAYDVSTFGYFPDTNIWSDQFERSPGARYFIPSFDEWIKAAHYDPNKLNDDGSLGGWWLYSDGTDTPLVGGPPGTGQANFGFSTGYTIPLQSYPQTQSPWGLMDVAGATSEWNERVAILSTGLRYRTLDGSNWNSSTTVGVADAVNRQRGNDFPDVPSPLWGFRVAAVVPTPGTGVLGVGLFLLYARRKRGALSCDTVKVDRSSG